MHKRTVFAVQNVEEAVTVSRCKAVVAVAVGVGNHFVHTVKVPAFARGRLEVPFDLASCGIDAEAGCSVEVVACVTFDRCASVAEVRVPRRRVTSTKDQRIGFNVIRTTEPRCAAASLPHVSRPGRVERASHGRFFAIQGAHVTFDHRTGPDELTCFGVACLNFANDTEFTARVTCDDEAVHDEGCCCVGVASAVIRNFLVPDNVASFQVQCDQTSVECTEEDLVAVDRSATVDHVTAWQNAFGETRVVLPNFFASVDVNRVEARIRTSDIHNAIINKRLGFLTTLFFTAKRERPCRHEVLN